MTRIPSTSDLCHAQSNKAYDKLAVISENIEELEALYNFIFDIQEYFRQLLTNYVHLHNDQTIDSIKTFTKPVRVKDINFYNVLDELDNIVNITTVYDGNNPCFDITLKRRDMEEQIDIIGNIRLKLNLSNNTPVFEAVDTVGSDEQSVVVVKYLNQVVSNLNALISALDVRVTNLENAVNTLSDRITSLESGIGNLALLDTVTEGSEYPVKSHGIYSFVKAIENELRSLISSSVGGIPVGSKTQKGILQVGNGIDVSEGTISINNDFIIGLVRGGTGNGECDALEYIYRKDSVKGTFDFQGNTISFWKCFNRVYLTGFPGNLLSSSTGHGASQSFSISLPFTVTTPITCSGNLLFDVSPGGTVLSGEFSITLNNDSLVLTIPVNAGGGAYNCQTGPFDIEGWIV